MRDKTIVLLLAAAFSQAVCAGEIYRCTAADGAVMYTNIACPTDSRVQHVATYQPEQAASRSAQVDAEAAQAAAISARLAQQAAADARRAAYEAEHAVYREQGEAEINYANDNSGDNVLWYPTYPYFGSGLARRGPHIDHHRHDGGNDGGHGGDGHGGGKPGAPRPMPLPVSSMSVNMLVRH